MSRQIDERAYRMTVEEFKARFIFSLTPEQQSLLDRAEGLGLELDVVIGYACGRQYLMDLDAVEE